jgi:predicted transcriptional regulator/DNA-binding XRE family transcriptional regulator
MPRSTLTGTRIREKRILGGIKQADLARSVGISPAYLNLIEHNKRKIGGKLLVDLARALAVEVGSLTQGAQTTLIDGLQNAGAENGMTGMFVETDRIEEFASRFPGWAVLVSRQHEHIKSLEHRIEALNDRLAHDPFLSEALHEVLSTVTAVRSTAGILNAGDDIDPEWQARFHRNMYEDSQRLATGAQDLVRYLDTIGKKDETPDTPQTALETWLANRDYAVPTAGEADDPQSIDGPAIADSLTSTAARALAHTWIRRAQGDDAKMPMAVVLETYAQHGPNPAALAQRTGVDLAAAMRRLATLPRDHNRPDLGLVICDGAGVLTFRKPLEGFAPPRFGGGCSLWPLYQALVRPMKPVRRVVEQMGQTPRQFLAYAVCQPKVQMDFDAPEVLEATMLFMPLDAVSNTPFADKSQHAAQLLGDVVKVGTNCRVCARKACPARREPSLMAAEQAGAE